MSKFSISKTSAILLGLSMLAVTAYPALARDATTTGTVKEKLITPATTLIQKRVEPEKENVENRITALREEQASKTAAFRTKLQAFKDKIKASVVERINTNLNMVNQKQTTSMQKALSTMSLILDKLEVRVNQGSFDIKNPASARTAIASARQAIATASGAATAQAQNDYTIQITSEGKIKINAKDQRDKLHTDLLALRKLVINAKEAVTNAIRIARLQGLPTASGVKEGTTK